MSVPLSYITVILIWSTTPLAIQWSGNETGFQLGVAVRMVIGLVALLTLLRLLKIEFPWHVKARQVYLVSGLVLYCAMTLVYWSAQYIPSGWLSVIFGLSPIITSLMAHIILRDSTISPMRLTGLLLGFSGLIFVFYEGLTISSLAMLGITGTILSATIQSLGSVILKRQQPDFHPIAITAGSITVSLPLFIANCIFSDNIALADILTIPDKTLWSIIYLGLIGSAFGFPLYFYLLKKLNPERVAIITLITPVTALLLGAGFNSETISDNIWTGTILIIFGLAVYEYGKYLPHVRKWKVRWLQRPL